MSVKKLTGAAFEGKLADVRAVLDAKPDIINDLNERGQTALYCAARNGHLDIVNYLIEKGANLNVVENNGSTPLHAAGFYGHPEVARALLEAGANRNAKNNYGSTPAAEANENGKTAVAKLITDFTPTPKPPKKKAKVEATSTPAVAAKPKIPSLISLCVKEIAKELTANPDDYVSELVGTHDEILKLMFSALPYSVLGMFARYTVDGNHPYQDVVTTEALNRGMKLEEDRYRNLFAQKRDDPVLKDPHLMLIDVHDQPELFTIRDGDAQEKKLEVVFPVPEDERPEIGSPSIVPTKEEFTRQFNTFTENQLDGLNWDNVLCAGGAVLGSLMPVSKKVMEMCGGSPKKNHLRGYFHSTGAKDQDGTAIPGGPFRSSVDIDLFIYGLTDPDALNAKLKEIHSVVVANNPFKVLVVRTGQAITFVSQYPYRHIQVVLRSYMSPAEILMGFDIDCVTVGYDGDKVWALPRAMRALNWRHNLVDLTRRSTTYEARLAKYAKRGFAVAVPGLDRKQLKPIPASAEGQRGLMRLMAMEKLAKSALPGQWYKSLGAKGTTVNADNVTTVWGKKFVHDDFGKEHQAVFEALFDATAYDYEACFLPWSPKYNASIISTLMSYRQCSNMYGAERFHIPVRDGWCVDEVIKDSGEADEFEEDGDDVAKLKAIHEEVKWLSVDPGRQYIGSFKPEYGDWFKDAYVEGAAVPDLDASAPTTGGGGGGGSGGGGAPAPMETDGDTIYLELNQGGDMAKFWRCVRKGTKTYVTFGKVGEAGTSQTGDRGTEEAAKDYMQKQAAAKKKKGYVAK